MYRPSAEALNLNRGISHAGTFLVDGRVSWRTVVQILLSKETSRVKSFVPLLFKCVTKELVKNVFLLWVF